MNKTEAITERCTAKQLSSFDVRNFENYLQRSLFFQQSRVQKITNLLKINSFTDIFQICFSRLELQEHLLCREHLSSYSGTRAQIIIFLNFSSYRTNNTCKAFFIFHFYELFLKVAFLRIHGHFALIKVKIRNVLLIMSQS